MKDDLCISRTTHHAREQSCGRSRHGGAGQHVARLQRTGVKTLELAKLGALRQSCSRAILLCIQCMGKVKSGNGLERK
jgi:hypothetical protein